MSTSPNSADPVRHDWTTDEARTLFALPFNDLLFRAQAAHRQFFDPNRVQLSNLISVKTGGCPEDCGYCPQSAKFDTGTKAEKLMDVNTVVAQAEQAKAGGATRFCMGAAWRSPKDRDLDKVCEMVSQVRDLGMETCVTLGMLRAEQAERLRDAGLDYYNHNLDTSEAFYGEIITTRTFADRIDTLSRLMADLYRYYEIILVDNASRDGSAALRHRRATKRRATAATKLGFIIITFNHGYFTQRAACCYGGPPRWRAAARAPRSSRPNQPLLM